MQHSVARISTRGDAEEREADRAADDALRAGALPISAPASGGESRPLDAVTRGFFEQRFGHDFSAVRVHADADSAKSAGALAAKAYTVGSHVVFGAGRYRPDLPDGQRLLAHELAHVVQFSTGRAGSGAVLRQEQPDGKPLPKATVKQHGIVYKTEGVTLRDAPSPQGAAITLLPFNTRVFVDSEQPGWYFVTTDDGHSGYCAQTHIRTGLPEPEAKIHWVAPGETALDISRAHYGGAAEWGSDHRFYVSGLVFVNAGEGKRGIYKPSPDASWETTQTRAGYMIWIPSLAFMKSLRDKVPSGSITYEAWQAVKGAVDAAVEFVVGGAAFVAGLLHGALESLWDVLVGLKDLAVMLWDILKSLVTGNLVSDAKELWEQLKNLDWGALVEGWLDRFAERWNAPDLLARWHFRGWVVGYAIMEVLLLVFSGGVIQGIKWIGKASKAAKIIAGLPKVQKFVEAVKTSKAAERLARALSRGGAIAEDAAAAVRWMERLLANPKIIWGRSPEEIADVLRLAGRQVISRQSKKGSKLAQILEIKGDRKIMQIQVHPGGGRHGGSYYKISTSDKGIIKVVDRATYVAIPGEKATIIYMTGLEGWLVRAVAANSLAQSGRNQIPIGPAAQDEEE